MTIIKIDAGEDHCQYVGQFYQEQYERLRRYFLRQLGDGSEIDDCIRETMRHFFFFMEDRDWEREAQYITVYLMSIAGKVAERRLECAAGRGLFSKVRAEAVRTIKERVEFMTFFLRPPEHDGGHPSEV